MTTLNCKKTQLNSLPYSIGAMKSLQTINLEGTQIKELPDSICALSSLKTLNLKDTPIDNKGIPSALYSMPGLEMNITGTNVE